MSLIEAIDREASALPLDFQREVLDFIGFLRTKVERPAHGDWLDQAWGASPDFPDRSEQPPLSDIPSL